MTDKYIYIGVLKHKTENQLTRENLTLRKPEIRDPIKESIYKFITKTDQHIQHQTKLSPEPLSQVSTHTQRLS